MFLVTQFLLMLLCLVESFAINNFQKSLLMFLLVLYRHWLLLLVRNLAPFHFSLFSLTSLAIVGKFFISIECSLMYLKMMVIGISFMAMSLNYLFFFLASLKIGFFGLLNGLRRTHGFKLRSWIQLWMLRLRPLQLLRCALQPLQCGRYLK